MSQFLELLAVIDFGNMSFKEVGSLSTLVEQTLNQDSQLDRNQPQSPRPDLMSVHEKIQKS